MDGWMDPRFHFPPQSQVQDRITGNLELKLTPIAAGFTRLWHRWDSSEDSTCEGCRHGRLEQRGRITLQDSEGAGIPSGTPESPPGSAMDAITAEWNAGKAES